MRLSSYLPEVVDLGGMDGTVLTAPVLVAVLVVPAAVVLPGKREEMLLNCGGCDKAEVALGVAAPFAPLSHGFKGVAMTLDSV